jgi:non-ribosomal peptide synthetase component F
VQSFDGGRHVTVVTGPVLDGLRRLAREEKASLFMASLAAFQLLLHRYCGQDDIVVGTPVVNREREELKSLIGFFSNTLVMRGDFAGNHTFRRLLRQTREAALGAYGHQTLPFETLVNRLQPVRDLSRNPIFQVFFAHLNTEPIASGSVTGSAHLDGLTVAPFAHGKVMTHFDLELDVAESPTGLTTRYVYSRDLFDAATIERMARHYHNLLESIVAAPDEPIGRI